MASLASLRRRALLSQRELARRAGVGASSVYLIERGRVTPRPATMRKLAAAVGVRDPLEVDEFRQAADEPGARKDGGNPGADERRRRLEPLMSPAVESSLRRLRRRYKKHLVPLEELQRELGATIPEGRLAEELRWVRGK